MAPRSRSSSISVAERLIVSACALAIAISACRKQSPQGVETAPSASAALGASAQSKSSAAADAPVAPRLHRIGQTAVAADYTLLLSEVKSCDRTAIAPRPGNVRLGVKVEIAGQSEHDVPVNPFYARLVDRERDGYAYAATFGGCEPALKSAHVSKGQSLSGWITFEIPEKASGLELTYSPYILDRGEQSLKFALGR